VSNSARQRTWSPASIRAVHSAAAALPPALAMCLFLVGWEATVRVTSVQSFLLPSPTHVATALYLDRDVLKDAVVTTAIEAIGGLAGGVLAGIVMAVITVRWVALRRGLIPIAIAANSIPTIALAPIANTWFGSTNPVSKMVIVGLIVFFPTVINTARGLTLVDPRLLELMRSYGASETATFVKARSFNALPYVFTALKIAAPLSLISAMIAEYFGGPRTALGIYVLDRARIFQFADAWAAIVVASLVGIGMYLFVVVIEDRLLPWDAAVRSGRRAR
jgi:NitT/TauT family transport system permease protein